MSKDIYYPSISKIFSLNISNKGLLVPPKDYGLFLCDCIDEFERFILKEHKSDSLEEAKEKYQKKIKKLNPKMDENELLKYSLYIIQFGIYGCVKEIENKRRLNIEKERVLVSYPLSFINNKSEIDAERYVQEFNKKLDHKFPNRKGKMKQDFEFILRLNDLSDSLKTDIKLRDWGIVCESSKSFIEIPAIQIKSEVIKGSSRIPKQIVDNLENVVNKYYDISSISYETRYEEVIK